MGSISIHVTNTSLSVFVHLGESWLFLPPERRGVLMFTCHTPGPVHLCSERWTEKLVSQYVKKAIIQSVFLSSTCLHKLKKLILLSIIIFPEGKWIFLGLFWHTHTVCVSYIYTFQKEISSQTVKIKRYFRQHLGFLTFPHWQNHLGKL